MKRLKEGWSGQIRFSTNNDVIIPIDLCSDSPTFGTVFRSLLNDDSLNHVLTADMTKAIKHRMEYYESVPLVPGEAMIPINALHAAILTIDLVGLVN